MYFYLIENKALVDEVAAFSHSDYELQLLEKELRDKNGETVVIVRSDKRLTDKEIKNHG